MFCGHPVHISGPKCAFIGGALDAGKLGEWNSMNASYFESFARTSSGRRARTLLQDHEVKSDQIFAMVLAEVIQNLPHLEEGAKYTTEDLCGPDIWGAWFQAQGSVAGMSLAYLVRNRVVKLFRHRTPSGAGKAYYRTSPPPELVCLRPIRIVRLRRPRNVGNKSLGSMTCL